MQITSFLPGKQQDGKVRYENLVLSPDVSERGSMPIVQPGEMST